MFAKPNYPTTPVDIPRKRVRSDEEDLDLSSTSFSEHRTKRLQCLPHRVLPESRHQRFPSITPLNSNLDEAVQRCQESQWSHSRNNRIESNMMGVASPPQLQSNTDVSNGRLPTPIQPSFAAQVRGQQCEWAGPGPIVKTLNGLVEMGHHQTGFTDDQFVPRAMAVEADWQSIQNYRRLPSPISECEDAMVNSTPSSPTMVLDNGFGECIHCDAEVSTLSPQPSPPRVMEHPNAMMDFEARPVLESSENEQDAASSSPTRRGHIRSRHTVNNWTWQPGMKKSFSIGYRSDCEKCRNKVPGHFNHIVIS